jgi:DNA polymerase III delta prime subunit
MESNARAEGLSHISIYACKHWRSLNNNVEHKSHMPHNTQPALYIFSGLPGTGKSTLAQRLAGKLRCAYLRIDTIEQTIRDLCSFDVQEEGYRLAYRVAAPTT